MQYLVPILVALSLIALVMSALLLYWTRCLSLDLKRYGSALEQHSGLIQATVALITKMSCDLEDTKQLQGYLNINLEEVRILCELTKDRLG